VVANHINEKKTPPLTSRELRHRHHRAALIPKTPVKTSHIGSIHGKTPPLTSRSDVNGGVSEIKYFQADVFGGILTAVGAADDK